MAGAFGAVPVQAVYRAGVCSVQHHVDAVDVLEATRIPAVGGCERALGEPAATGAAWHVPQLDQVVLRVPIDDGVGRGISGPDQARCANGRGRAEPAGALDVPNRTWRIDPHRVGRGQGESVPLQAFDGHEVQALNHVAAHRQQPESAERDLRVLARPERPGLQQQRPVPGPPTGRIGRTVQWIPVRRHLHDLSMPGPDTGSSQGRAQDSASASSST